MGRAICVQRQQMAVLEPPAATPWHLLRNVERRRQIAFASSMSITGMSSRIG